MGIKICGVLLAITPGWQILKPSFGVKTVKNQGQDGVVT
jgi:hypothetical protein